MAGQPSNNRVATAPAISDLCRFSTAGQSSATARPRGEILAVDDEPAVVELLVECLTVAGYRGTGATSPAEALQHLRARPFDVVLCDLLMPEMDGVELMVKARLEAPDTAIIVVTAVADIDTAIRSMRLGAYDYLIKPISPGDVVLRVSSAIETRRHVLETRRAEERLQERYSQLQHLADVKDNLVQMLVHDLKTPLASAMGYMELLERKTGGSFSERQLRYLQQAHASCKDVLRMTATMLDITRLERGTLQLQCEPLDVPDILRDAATEIEPLLQASGGKIEVTCQTPAARAFGDREIVRRILGNLLANAVKHTPPGSHIRVAAEPGENGATILSVADDGQGIPPEDQERIFEKFCELQSDGKQTGAGIGLAFCRMAAEAHGGRIWVESAPGQGSAFRLSLPPPHHPTSSQQTGDPR